MRSFVAAFVALGVLSLAAPALADANDVAARNTARKLGAEGLELFEKGDYEKALEKFNLANQLVPAPTLGVRIARCLAKLGRLVEASEMYLEVVRQELPRGTPLVQKKAQAEAAEEREKLLPRIPSLTIDVTGPRGDALRVIVDGDEMPSAMIGQRRPIDPGKHAIQAIRPDITVTRDVTLAEGRTEAVALELPALPAAAPSAAAKDDTWVTVGWIGVGVGAAGVVLGAGNGLLAMKNASDLEATCGTDRACPASESGSVDFLDFTRVASTTGFIVGAVGLAVGIPLLVLGDDGPGAASGASVTPWVGPSGAGVVGRF